MFEQITILGTGLLGASIGLAARERAIAKRVQVWSRRAETRTEAAATSWVDAVFDSPEGACRDSDLIILCTPVATIGPLLESIAGSLAPDALVTDVGSTKANICRQAAEITQLNHAFIGSHPMAGSEQTGMAHARASLFEQAACIVTPLEEADASGLDRLEHFWKALGMRVIRMRPEQHDEAVAHVSHLPHLLAAALTRYLGEQPEAWKAIAGSGLRDTTRIASGDPLLWAQIFEHNRAEVLQAVDGFEAALQAFKSALQEKDHQSLLDHLQHGKQFRDSLRT